MNDELDQVAEQWKAEGHHDQRTVDKKVEAMNAPPPAAPVVPAAPVAPPADPELVKIAAVAWSMLDRLIVGLAAAQLGAEIGPKLALKPSEVAELAEPTAKVLEKYIPDFLAKMTTTPEGVLLGTVAMVYGVKVAGLMLLPDAKPPAPDAPIQAPAAA